VTASSNYREFDDNEGSYRASRGYAGRGDAGMVVGVRGRSGADHDSPVRAGRRPDGCQRQGLYARHCSHCHGFNMAAGSVADNLRQFPHEDKARFIHSVIEGKNGRMPPWGDLLSREDIDDLWAYVKTGGKQ